MYGPFILGMSWSLSRVAHKIQLMGLKLWSLCSIHVQIYTLGVKRLGIPRPKSVLPKKSSHAQPVGLKLRPNPDKCGSGVGWTSPLAPIFITCMVKKRWRIGSQPYKARIKKTKKKKWRTGPNLFVLKYI